jgi:hypothetical protein
MGNRANPRKEITVAVRIFGTDIHGKVFSEKVLTVDVSQSGAELAGVHAELKLDEIIGLTYANHKVHFRIKWIGTPGTPKAGHVGLLNISPEKALWDFPLPKDSTDAFQPGSVEMRQDPRFRCQNSVEVHVQGGASFWGTVADLSLGGCYIEMPLPLEPGTKAKMAIWFGQNKAWAEAVVTHRTPGLGVGMKFTKISAQDRDQIDRFLRTLTPFAKKPLLSRQKT